MLKKIIDKDNYHGITIKVNNSRSCSKIRVNRRERFIEFNYYFMQKRKESQQVFLFEWARFQLRKRDVYWCDKKALKRCKDMGYDESEIFDLIRHVKFSSYAMQQKRLFYLITEDPVEYKTQQMLKKLNPLSWLKSLIAKKK